MAMELDHLFVCTAPGAPEAQRLIRFGLCEGPPNQHPGQGTACRRFPFANAMIELLWVSDAGEAQSDSARRTLLWERWSGRKRHASPFGICLRPADSHTTAPPFPTWEYRPSYLPEPLCLQIGEAGVEEPMWVFLSFMRRAQREQWFSGHPAGIREITGLTLITPAPLGSEAAQTIVESGALATCPGDASLLEIEFDGGRQKQSVDFRPYLPFVFKL
jgi:hypothetical protein